ncbi:hypothetical protein [Nocardia sp. CC227C]|uniref:hypothetical protein n=1 Tax=Nocardia sp. CC227C TaxID=3044562 RepID=UPI00278C66F5|nr:hypothetical protein [Nocardia sp. CC227C]
MQTFPRFIASAASTAVVLGCLTACTSATTTAPTPTTPRTQVSTSRQAPPTPTVAYDVPTHASIEPELTITDKQCFGSAGCNFEYELAIAAIGPANFDPAERYRVTIVIDEGTSWERIHSLELTGTRTDVVTGRVSSDTHSTPVAAIQRITPL